jgi:hypothetical protein
MPDVRNPRDKKLVYAITYYYIITYDPLYRLFGYGCLTIPTAEMDYMHFIDINLQNIFVYPFLF